MPLISLLCPLIHPPHKVRHIILYNLHGFSIDYIIPADPVSDPVYRGI